MFTRRRNRVSGAIAIALLVAATAGAQKKNAPADNKNKGADTTRKSADSARKGPLAPTAIKPYKDVITAGMKTSKGYFTVHQKDDKYYFEIPNNILHRDILIVSRVSKASADMRNGSNGYAGDQIAETVYRFEKGPSNKMFLRRISFSEYAGDSSKAMFASVSKNNVQAIAMAFPIAAISPDSSGVVIDATDLLNSDNDILYFENKKLKDRAGMGSQQNDRSYIEYVHTFPSNIEVHAVKTYSAGLNPTSSNYTIELNASMLLLPLNPMRPRLLDERVGYFATGFRDFDADPQGVKNTIYANRWRLEPKPEDMEKYKRGELVEPAKPIVFYIDPVTPKKWVPYLMQGVNDWQKAFEKAGFKNAIIAKEAPSREEDSTWSIDDATHSAIIYRPSAIANAMGPSVADPRSGEILESHIFWYHNVMSLLHSWYMMQCAAVDPRARKLEFDDSVMGTLIRFVSSHEVGHTLGLRHNFGSSSTVPVENLRNKAWVEEHGHTPSIMDYARFNYVAQPEDNIGDKGLFPRIGDYDQWAIQWGYTYRPEFKTAEDEKKVLAHIVSDSLAKNHRLWFGSEMEPTDARSQSEDLGNDAVAAGNYGIKNLKRILPHLIEWTTRPEEGYASLFEHYGVLLSQYSRYVGHVLANIGCEYRTEKIASQPGPLFEVAPYQVNKNAVQFLNDQVFTTPLWLKNDSILLRLQQLHASVSFGIELNKIQEDVINNVLTRNRISRLWWEEQNADGKKVYTVTDLLNDLNKGIFKELYEGKNVDSYRRNMQKIYVGRLIQQVFIAGDPLSTITGSFTYHLTQTDLMFLLKDAMKQQQQLCKKALLNPSLDKPTKYHLQDLIQRIDAGFKMESQTVK
ncbi:protein of unknown function [Filimonas lacunae]|uniref:Zinc-dependent metalloprotease n=1 Tax=Filimonas lacunae TaxID=477680 RepID=A0A173MJF8_9BACT|nr:zinc-dependent metalloprotease [Filimonas lacunae]BAV07617.1 hypothetical protein FLA_3643 [Filimonas lacunae]SIT29774.1 protein of unknown function [Filimonas lacunae]